MKIKKLTKYAVISIYIMITMILLLTVSMILVIARIPILCITSIDILCISAIYFSTLKIENILDKILKD